MEKIRELEELLGRGTELRLDICDESRELAVEYKEDILAIIAYAKETKRLKDRIKTIGDRNMGELALCEECSSKLDWEEITECHCPLGGICSVYNGDSALEFDWDMLTVEKFGKWFTK
ncbi:MAG: hypothetical protein ACRCTS_06965 [Fusobacteriaceae bacterium]